MRRIVVVAAVLIALSTLQLQAGRLENRIKGRWLGAWVVLQGESFSDCSSMYTNNRVNGRLVKSRGRFGFEPGELAKIDRMDIKRSRLDIHLSLAEPLRISHQEGPFTLFDHVTCRIELEVEIPRAVVKDKNDSAVERTLLDFFERYATFADAEGSVVWNQREVEPFPDDYGITLARLSVWRAEQTNVSVQAKIDEATYETSGVADRMSSDPLYLEGFARGVDEAKAHELSNQCSAMLALSLPRLKDPSKPDSSEEARVERGYRDGKLLYYGLEMIRELPGCFVPVPDPPELRAES